ncbi:MAG: flagellar basal body-associated FliL family protein [Halobacteriovoraceae bacterium]|jgi:flagellar protein FliL|nr:flagellar basal body-associated FliL family protein [Halobacteriovoraceae bacterium]
MTGNPAIDKVILGLNGLVVIASTALVIYSHTSIKKPLTERGKEFGSMIENSMLELKKPPVIMEEVVVNLYSRESRLRFLNTQMNLVLFQEQDRELVMLIKPYVFDAIIDIAGNMSPKELNTITGKILLESRIKNHVNNLIKKQIIKKILFSKFIVQ